jgi:hypothetical protein
VNHNRELLTVLRQSHRPILARARHDRRGHALSIFVHIVDDDGRAAANLQSLKIERHSEQVSVCYIYAREALTEILIEY